MDLESRERGAQPVIFIIGASGLVGSRLKEVAQKYNYPVFAPRHEDLDIVKLSLGEIIDYLSRKRPDFVVNPAALADVDWCEDPQNRDLVWETNVKGPKKLAIASCELDIPFGHISTDYVLSDRHYPHTEDEEVSPVPSVYAQSKAEAERELGKVVGKIHIIRVQRPFGDDPAVKRSDMLRDAIRLNQEGKPFYGITDQMITPTYVTDLARAIFNIIESQEYGIWHVSSPKPVSPYEFVKMAFKELENLGIPINWDLLKEGKFHDFEARWKALRPCHTAFDVNKYESRFGKIRSLKEQLREWAANLVTNLRNA